MQGGPGRRRWGRSPRSPGGAASCVTVIARLGAEEAAVPTASSTGTIWARPGPAFPHGHSGLTSNNFLLPPAGGHPTHLEPRAAHASSTRAGGTVSVLRGLCLFPSPVLSQTFPRAHLSGAASLSLGPAPEADSVGRPDQPCPPTPASWALPQLPRASWPPPTREGPLQARQRHLSLCLASWLGAPGKPFPTSHRAPWEKSGPFVWDVLRVEISPRSEGSRNRIRVLCDLSDPLCPGAPSPLDIPPQATKRSRAEGSTGQQRGAGASCRRWRAPCPAPARGRPS